VPARLEPQFLAEPADIGQALHVLKAPAVRVNAQLPEPGSLALSILDLLWFTHCARAPMLAEKTVAARQSEAES
jgi:hypothetical protein